MGYGFYQEPPPALPHPQISTAVFLIVEEAMRVAWQRLQSRNPSPIDVSSATEDEITHDFYEILHNEVFGKKLVDGFDNNLFSDIAREPKIRTFDRGSLDKMPDLLVRLAGRTVHLNSQDGIFVECKPVGASHPVGTHYGAKGIARFVQGEYAWAMHEALMIAYTDPGYELELKLSESLQARASEFKVMEQPRSCPKSIKTDFCPSVYITRHKRSFVYVETSCPAPPICIRHLWLCR